MLSAVRDDKIFLNLEGNIFYVNTTLAKFKPNIIQPSQINAHAEITKVFISFSIQHLYCYILTCSNSLSLILLII